MTGKWDPIRLGDVCKISRTKHNGESIPYVGMEHIESGGTGQLVVKPVPAPVKSATYRFNGSHVLYGRLRPYLNKVLLPEFDGHCSGEVLPLECSGRLDRRFLFFWLTSDATVSRIHRTSTGARMPRADLGQVLDFDIPLPSLSEQERIVTILDEAFAAIATATANAEKGLANTHELFQSILDQRTAASGDGWSTQELQKDVRFIDYRGRTPPKTAKGMRLITAKNVKMGAIHQEPREYVDPGSYDDWMTRGIPVKGDVLFTTEAPLGNVARLDTEDKVVFAQRIITLQPDRGVIDPKMLHYVLRSSSIQRQIQENATGATATGIKASLLKRITLSLPADIKVQTRVAAELQEAEKACKRLAVCQEHKAAALLELRQSILHKAFTGELTADLKATDCALCEAGL